MKYRMAAVATMCGSGDKNDVFISGECKWDKTSRLITAIVIKKETGPFWPRLLESKSKQHWLKVDFDKMKDSDDSSEEEDEMPAGMGQPDLSQMMAQMGRGTGAADLGDLDDDDDEDDSDDDELPDLETADDTPNGVPETPAAEADGQACNA